MTLRRACTLLELVQVVNESARNDEEVVATVAYLVNSGRVRLCGTFAGAKIALRPALLPFLCSCPSSPGPGPHQNSPGVPQKLGNLKDYPASHSSPDTSLHASNSVPNRVSLLCSRISLKALAIHACLNCISGSMW